MNPDEPPDDELFELFRGLRERVFEGSAAFLGKVMRGVEFRVAARPEVPLAVTMAVHLTNFLSSLVGPGDEARDPPPPDPEAPKDPDRS